MLLRKNTFSILKFNESYEVCGEDIELCLNIRDKLGLNIVYCPLASGIHYSSYTRRKSNQYGNSVNDLNKMRITRKEFMENANIQQLKNEIKDSKLEVKALYLIQEKNNFFKRFAKRLFRYSKKINLYFNTGT